jgi:hypothetical protein
VRKGFKMIEEIREVYSEFMPILSDEELLNTSWVNIGRVHDWRNYIWDEHKENWTGFSDVKRLLLFCRAEELADVEEWE